jgi:hypothetical protein
MDAAFEMQIKEKLSKLKFEELYKFFELNGIKPNIDIEEAHKITYCPHCNKVDNIYPLAICDLSEFDNIDLSYGRLNLTNAKVYSTCWNCLNEFSKKRRDITFISKETKINSFETITEFYFGVQTHAKNPLHKGIITEDMFIFSEDEGIYRQIEENPKFMAGQILVESSLLRNEISNLKALHKKQAEKRLSWILGIAFAIVVLYWLVT